MTCRWETQNNNKKTFTGSLLEWISDVRLTFVRVTLLVLLIRLLSAIISFSVDLSFSLDIVDDLFKVPFPSAGCVCGEQGKLEFSSVSLVWGRVESSACVSVAVLLTLRDSSSLLKWRNLCKHTECFITQSILLNPKFSLGNFEKMN